MTRASKVACHFLMPVPVSQMLAELAAHSFDTKTHVLVALIKQEYAAVIEANKPKIGAVEARKLREKATERLKPPGDATYTYEYKGHLYDYQAVGGERVCAWVKPRGGFVDPTVEYPGPYATMPTMAESKAWLAANTPPPPEAREA